MAIAYDATSAGLASSNVSGSGAGFTLAHTAASGADVFLAVEVDYTGTPSAAQYNGTNLTLLAAPFANNGSYGSVSLYHGPGLGTGSSENFSFTIPPTSYFVAGSVSYTGVGSVGTATTTYGSSTSASTGSISCSAGQMIVAAIGMGTYNDGASKTISSTSGGTNRYKAGSGNYVGLAISDATSTATLAAALSGSVAWSTASVVLSPSTGGVVVSPTAATITTTGGTPNIPGNPVTVTPSGATIAATGGTPGLIETPLNPSRTKLLNGQDSVRLGIGDSTLFSAEDTGFSELTTPWTPGNLRGWLGREAIEEANEVDATVIAYTWNYPTNTGYTGPATLRSGSGPTLTVYVGGWPGGVMADYIAKPAMLADVNPDVVFIQDGFNETNATTFATNMNTYIGTVQSTYPGVPIIVTTANATTATSESGHPTFATLFAAMITSLLPGKSLPLSPPLQLSSPGVWVIDTQQADLVAADLFTDGLHPIGQGYDKQANYMAWVLAGIERTATPDSATISITPGTPAVTAPTVISPTSAAVSSSGGSPDIEQTGGSTTATPSSAVITTTPGTPVIEQSGPITVTPNAAHITTTAGTPTVLNSSTPPDVAPENTVLVRAESRRVLV